MPEGARRDEQLKLVAVGQGKTGKACLLMTAFTGEFPHEFRPSFMDPMRLSKDVDDKQCLIEGWHSLGYEDYDRLRPLAYPLTDVFWICFDLSCRTSFENVKNKYYPEINHFASEVPIILVGTKLDLANDAKDSATASGEIRQDAENLAHDIEAYTYIEVAAATGHGVENLMQESVRCVRLYREQNRVSKS